MKKLLALTLAVMMLFTLVACATEEATESSAPAASSTPATESSAAPESSEEAPESSEEPAPESSEEEPTPESSEEESSEEPAPVEPVENPYEELEIGKATTAPVVDGIIRDYFGGDGMKYAKAYYETLAQLPNFAKTDILGHADLICKFSEKENFFDVDSPVYQKYALDALDALTGKIPFFVLTAWGRGAIITE